MNSKLSHIFDTFSMTDYDFVILTETWLTPGVFNSEICDDRYSIFRNDRNFARTGKSRGGGVLVATSNTFQSTEIILKDMQSYEIEHIDLIVVKSTCKWKSIVIVAIYIPPATKIEHYEQFFDLLANSLTGDDEIIIAGDFNISDYSNNCHTLSLPSSKYCQFVNEFMNFFDLFQINYVTNAHDRILDLIFCQKDIKASESLDSFVDVDTHHPPLEFSLPVQTFNKDKKTTNNFHNRTFNFKKANFPLLYDRLSQVEWKLLEEFRDIESACKAFYTKINDIVASCVPLRNIPSRSPYPPWYNPTIIKTIKSKYRYLRQFKKTGNLTALEFFKDLRRKLKSDVSNAHKTYLENIEKDIGENPKAFWSYLGNLRRTNTIPSNLTFQGNVISDPQDIADSFAEFFESVFKRDFMPMPEATTESSDIFQLITVNEEMVIKAIKHLNSKSTAGPDEIPSFVLKDCAHVFGYPLQILFNLSLKTQIFPACWKVSRITPIPKKDKKTEIENYRPVVIESNFAKVFGKILYDSIYHYVSPKVPENMHGFSDGRSTLTNLTQFTQYICEAIDQKKQVDVLYTDLSKAFDSVNHSLLLQK